MDRNPIPTLFYGLLLLRSHFVAPESVCAALCGLFLLSPQSLLYMLVECHTKAYNGYIK